MASLQGLDVETLSRYGLLAVGAAAVVGVGVFFAWVGGIVKTSIAQAVKSFVEFLPKFLAEIAQIRTGQEKISSAMIDSTEATKAAMNQTTLVVEKQAIAQDNLMAAHREATQANKEIFGEVRTLAAEVRALVNKIGGD